MIFKNPILPLRTGLGFVNLYAGYYLLVDPARYYHYVPDWFAAIVSNFITIDTFLRIQGVGELCIAFLILAWFLGPQWTRLGALLLAFEMLLIVIFIGVDGVTFRNIGLLGGALTLYILEKNP